MTSLEKVIGGLTHLQARRPELMAEANDDYLFVEAGINDADHQTMNSFSWWYDQDDGVWRIDL
jgi:hypothetical protein